MTVAEALAAGRARLASAGIEGAARDARWLLAEAMGVAPERIGVMGPDAVGPAAAAAYDAMIARRAAREPVARILGRRQFWGRDFRVTPEVLDPRPETECLIAAALEEPARRLLDLGTGSGILAVTLLAEWPEATGVATDLSSAALEVARANAERHGVAGRLRLVQADWAEGIEGPFDLVVSNPPYLAEAELRDIAPEVRHDPGMALSPGGDGLAAYRAIAAAAPRLLAPGGRLIVEIGATQGRAVAGIFLAAGLDDVAVGPDLDVRDRVVSARRFRERQRLT
ncbi:peptide chain release factor N(5)-glutamine methyltransferase [Rhodosalinus halophilus]|uniref:Release factor glutamine methyltransferase n=1 Tax=Rhodosalinus halophilus TaxID=2259333 RepID=A0A365U5Y8_9RHOB|nr:peptide chain release factor N(5)-glutamine methyltransferase [Rhodosalinus halophilus]RBI82932.1 peptide chain release factor N(5)-glutamine methyltransferase [Rhodosalinus halophilus]